MRDKNGHGETKGGGEWALPLGVARLVTGMLRQKKKGLCRGYREGCRGVMQKLKEAPATREEDVMVTLRRGMRDAAEELGGGVRERGRGRQEKG